MSGKYRGGALFVFVLAAVVIASVAFFRHSASEMIISDRMSEFIDAVDRSTTKDAHKLIIFDLDDTLFMSKEILGTPTWFYHMINILRQRGAAKSEAYNVMREIDRNRRGGFWCLRHSHQQCRHEQKEASRTNLGAGMA